MTSKVISDNFYPASFRDNNCFTFQQNGILYRQTNKSYKENYDFLINSGLYKKLFTDKLLIEHEEVTITPQDINCYKALKPTQINFISYPTSWCFSMIEDAVLLTLNIQVQALYYGMILKDASSYNIQFLNGKPIFIDTLSFEN